MPAGDRTGPAGMGPRTGRGLGLCSGYAYPGYGRPGGGWRRFGGGRGGYGYGSGGGYGYGYGNRSGFGRRNRRFAWDYPWSGSFEPFPAADEITYLKDNVRYMENSLRDARSRLSELESKAEVDTPG